LGEKKLTYAHLWSLCQLQTASVVLRGGDKRDLYPKMPKLDLTTDTKHVASLVNVNMWL